MTRCLIGLGSNVSDRAGRLEFAARRLAEANEVELVARSRSFETKPIGGPPDQSPYLNEAALIKTELEPEPLLDMLHEVEAEAGRTREVRWGPRTLDLDLLLYGEEVLRTSRLVVPHPWLALRRFVLRPASEVAADMLHPVLGRTIGKLWRHANESPRYVAFSGGTAALRAQLARAAAKAAGATLVAGGGEDLERRLAGSPSPPWDVAIEFVARWSDLLAAEHWRGQDSWIVSDFHWPDLATDLFQVLDARALLGTRPRDLRTRITVAGRRVLVPRFVVLLEGATGGTGNSPRADVELAGIPVLRIQGGEPQGAALKEIAAAIAAMSE